MRRIRIYFDKMLKKWCWLIGRCSDIAFLDNWIKPANTMGKLTEIQGPVQAGIENISFFFQE